MGKILFVSKLKFLEMIEKLEIVGPTELANQLGITYNAASLRLFKYKKAGLIEPMVIEKGRYCLSNKGQRHLDYLRKMKEES